MEKEMLRQEIQKESSVPLISIEKDASKKESPKNPRKRLAIIILILSIIIIISLILVPLLSYYTIEKPVKLINESNFTAIPSPVNQTPVPLTNNTPKIIPPKNKGGGGSSNGGGGVSPICTTNCSGKECGDDGCGESCGTCVFGYECNSSFNCSLIPCTNDTGCFSEGLFCYKNLTYHCNQAADKDICLDRTNLTECTNDQLCQNITGCYESRNCSSNNNCTYLNNLICNGDVITNNTGVCSSSNCVVNSSVVQDCTSFDSFFCTGTNRFRNDYFCSVNQCINQSVLIQNCNDTLFCNGQEACSLGSCIYGNAPQCADAIDCTMDTCSETTGCIHTANNSLCSSRQFCDVTSGCVDNSSCAGTDISCGTYPACTNCNFLDNCYSGHRRDYFCNLTNACSFNIITNTENLTNNNCNDSIDNDCDITTDSQDSGCTIACSDTCSSLGYECGSQQVCGTIQNCGSCASGSCINGSCVQSNCTYFVDSTVSNCLTYNPSSRSCTGGTYRVYNNFRTGFTSATAGNTVCFRGGDYALNQDESLTVTSIGTLSNKIKFVNYNNEKAVLRGGISIVNYPFIFRDSRFVDFIGLNFTGYLPRENNLRYYANDLVSLYNSQNIEIINCSFGSSNGNDDILGRTGRGRSLSVAYSQYVNLNGIYLDCVDSPNKVTPGGWGGDGVRVQSSSNMVIENSRFGDCGHSTIHLVYTDNITIQKNIVINRLHNSIDLNWGNNSVIRNNIIYSMNIWPTEETPGETIELLYSSNNKVYNNILYNGENEAKGITPAGSSTEGNADNNEIYNNLIYNSGRSGVGLASLEYARNNKLYNNIIYGIKDHPAHAYFGEIYIAFVNGISSLPTNYYGTEVRNNIIRSFDSIKPIRIKGSARTPIYDYTATEFNNQFSWAENNIGSDPLFVSIPSYDFHLTANSPAIDAGICIDYITTDFDGNPRPIGSGCDIGPYEYTGLNYNEQLENELNSNGLISTILSWLKGFLTANTIKEITGYFIKIKA